MYKYNKKITQKKRSINLNFYKIVNGLLSTDYKKSLTYVNNLPKRFELFVNNLLFYQLNYIKPSIL